MPPPVEPDPSGSGVGRQLPLPGAEEWQTGVPSGGSGLSASIAAGQLRDALRDVTAKLVEFGKGLDSALGQMSGGAGGTAGTTYGKTTGATASAAQFGVGLQGRLDAAAAARAAQMPLGVGVTTEDVSTLYGKDTGASVNRHGIFGRARNFLRQPFVDQPGVDEAARLMEYQQAGAFIARGAQRVSNFFGTMASEGYPIDYAANRMSIMSTGNAGQRGSYLQAARDSAGFVSNQDLFTAMQAASRFNDPRFAMGMTSRLGLIDPTLGMAGGANMMQNLASPQVMHALAPYGGGLIAPGGGMRNTEQTVMQLANAVTGGQAANLTVAQARATFSETGQGRWSLRSAGVSEDFINQIQTLMVARAGGADIGTQAGLRAAGIGGEDTTLVDAELERVRESTRKMLDAQEQARSTLMFIADTRAAWERLQQTILNGIPGLADAFAAFGALSGPISMLATTIGPTLAAGIGSRIGSAGGIRAALGAGGGLGGLLRFGGKAAIVGGLISAAQGGFTNGDEGNLPGRGFWSLGGNDRRFFGMDFGTFAEGGNLGFLNPGNFEMSDLPFVGDAVGDPANTGTRMSIADAEALIRSRTGADHQVAGIQPALKIALAEMMQQNPRLSLTSGNRSYQEQVSLFEARYRPPYPGAPYREWRHVSGPPTAVPGTSKHETGFAVDLGPSSEYGWLRSNAPRWGLQLPMPEREPWHWELPGSGQATSPAGLPPGNDGAVAPGGGGGMSMAQGYGGIGITGTQERLMEVLKRAPSPVSFGGGGTEAFSSTESGSGAPSPAIGGAGSLSPTQIKQFAQAVGFSGDLLTTMTAIALAESRGNPRAYNGRGRDNSYGLWQINMIGAMGPERARALGIDPNPPYDELFDPATNARAARMIFDGQGLNAWSVYSGSQYRNYMDEARNAGDAVGAMTAVPTAKTSALSATSAPGPAFGGGGGRTITVQQLVVQMPNITSITQADAAKFARMIKDELENDDALDRVGVM